ncbi:MAG: VWA domain-containing protein [Candidatus Hodarchaeales archaeon]|jgi:magnesium chelatase subunit I
MIENEKNSQISTIEYPFHYLKGNKALKLLIALIKIDPSLGGLIIFGNTGTGKSEYLHVFQKIKLPLEVIVNCSYHCSPSGTNYCSSCNEVMIKGGEFELHSIDTPVRILPSTASIDAIVGSMSLNLKFLSGILGRVNNGYLLIDDFHLVPKTTLNVVIETWEKQVNHLHRNNLSIIHPSKFCLIATAKTSNHISPAILDKFALSYFLHDDFTVQQRVEIIDIHLDGLIEDNEGRLATNEFFLDKFQNIINESRKRLSMISIPEKCLSYIAQLCITNDILGQRADIALAKGARAIASLLDKKKVTIEDINLLAPFVLGHRIAEERKQSFIDQLYKERQSVGNSKKVNLKAEKNLDNTNLKNRILKPRKSREKLLDFLGPIICIVISILTVLILFSDPDVLQMLIGSTVMISIWSYLLYRSLLRRKEIMEQHGIGESDDNKNPDLTSFSRVKELRMSSKTKNEKKKSKKAIILDIEEDKSRRGKIARFIGIQRRKGLITITDHQRFILNIVGVTILLIFLPVYIFFLIILPVEFFASLLLIISCLFMIGFVIQALRNEYKVRRAVDMGASPDETSRSLNKQGIGSHTSFQGSFQNKETPFFESYEKKINDSLSKMGLIPEKPKDDTEVQLFQSSQDKIIENESLRVKAEFLPKIQDKTDITNSGSVGKRALSMSTVFTGRVIGSRPFTGYPRNIHLMSTVINSILRNSQKGEFQYSLPLSIELDDIREKVFNARVSATIIFVLDLSHSITNAINSVSSCVSWLSRQAYLYRDRVGIVAMKGTQGVVIQTPTSNLNLIKRKIKNFRVSGSTPLAGGLQKAIELIKMDRIRNKGEIIPMILLVTDGAANIPLLIDPRNGITRKTPLNKLGIDRAVTMAIEDTIYMAQIIKKEKISLTIFTTNLEAREIYEKDPEKIWNFSREKFDKMIYGKNLVKSRYFISLWSYRLIQLIREITNGYLYYISRYQPDLNHETLRIARKEIFIKLTNS